MTFNTVIGGPSATSYVSVASADEYLNGREDSLPWYDLDSNSTGTLSATARKQNILIQATREIDKTFRFYGERYGDDLKGSEDYQNLEFPRWDDTDADGNEIIPDEVKYCTYEQALWILVRNSPQTTEGENVVKLPKFSEQAYDYIKTMVTRAVISKNNTPWQGSNF